MMLAIAPAKHSKSEQDGHANATAIFFIFPSSVFDVFGRNRAAIGGAMAQ
jgi:hypothetical protein